MCRPRRAGRPDRVAERFPSPFRRPVFSPRAPECGRSNPANRENGPSPWPGAEQCDRRRGRAWVVVDRVAVCGWCRWECGRQNGRPRDRLLALLSGAACHCGWPQKHLAVLARCRGFPAKKRFQIRRCAQPTLQKATFLTPKAKATLLTPKAKATFLTPKTKATFLRRRRKPRFTFLRRGESDVSYAEGVAQHSPGSR